MFKRKDKNLWVEKYDGKTFYGKTQKVVIEKIREYRENKNQTVNMKRVLEEWYEEYEPTVSPGRAITARSVINRMLPYIGGRGVGDFRPVDLARMLRAVCDGRVRTTAQVYRTVLSMSFAYAVNAGYIDESPARDLLTPSNTLPSGHRPLPSDEDLRKVLADTSYPIGLFCQIAIFTGLRRGEILALTKSDINLADRTITVSKSLRCRNNQPEISTPKTENGNRIVYIPDQLYPLLQDLPYDIVVSDHGKYWLIPQFAYQYKLWAKSVGITATPHQFRHLYTATIIDLGLTPQDAQILLGHSTVVTTQRIYDHIRDQRRLAAALKTKSLSY
jgi:integrase